MGSSKHKDIRCDQPATGNRPAAFKRPVIALIILAGLTSRIAHSQEIPGIPEPGLLMYGSVRYAGDDHLAAISSVTVEVADAGGSTVKLNAATKPAIRVVSVNGQAFYIAHIPFETRRVEGNPPLLFAATPNSFELKSSASTFSRSATVNGVTAAFAEPEQNQFSFSAADRGRVERVDLTIPGASGDAEYAAWSQSIFGVGNPQGHRDMDPDGDGMKNEKEFASGTDPLSASSVFKLISFAPLPGGGMHVEWLSAPGRSYTVHRSTDLRSWAQVGEAISATAASTSFSDSDLGNSSSVNYVIRTNP